MPQLSFRSEAPHTARCFCISDTNLSPKRLRSGLSNKQCNYGTNSLHQRGFI